MKKCPYCAEEIQDEAVKCRYCNEFLVPQPEAPKPNSPLKNSKVNWTSPGNLQPEKDSPNAVQFPRCGNRGNPDCHKGKENKSQDRCQGKIPWYAKTATLVISFLTVGPFALPLVWFNPAYSRRKKVIVTVIVLALTYALVVVFLHAVKTLLDYYKQAGIF